MYAHCVMWNKKKKKMLCLNSQRSYVKTHTSAQQWTNAHAQILANTHSESQLLNKNIPVKKRKAFL